MEMSGLSKEQQSMVLHALYLDFCFGLITLDQRIELEWEILHGEED